MVGYGASHLTHPTALRAGKASLRRPSGRHDLVRGFPRELGHVVELERVAADTRRSGAHLYDEVANLRFRHQRANHVPAVPAVAGVEAEELAAAAGHDGVDLGGGF